MLEWLTKLFRKSERQQFLDTINALNAEAGGGPPKKVDVQLGWLPVHSGAIVLGDPQDCPAVTVPNVAADRMVISATMWRYPNGNGRISELRLAFGESAESSFRKIGELAIDSGKMFVADQADYEEYWTDVGPDRLGVILTPRDEEVLQLLTKQFKLRTRRVNRIRVEIKDPVSEEMEREIIAFLETFPKYAKFPFMHFYVQTNNSFERVNYMPTVWDILPLKDEFGPPMFACETGQGDGAYDVLASYQGDTTSMVKVVFDA